LCFYRRQFVHFHHQLSTLQPEEKKTNKQIEKPHNQNAASVFISNNHNKHDPKNSIDKAPNYTTSPKNKSQK